jgi:acetaldehyde dehydrogenase
MRKTVCAVLGSGNIGTDLTIKLLRRGQNVKIGLVVGFNPASEGLATVLGLGILTAHGGFDRLRRHPVYADVGIVFDATSASAHATHAPVLAADGKRTVDLTPAALGPYVVPAVNIGEHCTAANVNMVTCGGQAAIPIVAAISHVPPVAYAEMVASIASESAGPGTRANIDEFIHTTSRALEIIGGADRGKAIIVLNPARPQPMMRVTVTCLALSEDVEEIRDSVTNQVAQVQKYVPGYRLKQAVQFQPVSELMLPWSLEPLSGQKATVFLEIEGEGHYLPKYAGNLDIMTSAALAVGESLAVGQSFVESDLQTQG